MSLLDKIRKSGMTPEEVTNPMEDQASSQIAEPMTNPGEDEMFSEYEDEDMDAVIEYGPLGSIKELIFPLAAQATDRQILEFVMDILSERK
jgi:hypothetical protein